MCVSVLQVLCFDLLEDALPVGIGSGSGGVHRHMEEQDLAQDQRSVNRSKPRGCSRHHSSARGFIRFLDWKKCSEAHLVSYAVTMQKLVGCYSNSTGMPVMMLVLKPKLLIC